MSNWHLAWDILCHQCNNVKEFVSWFGQKRLINALIFNEMMQKKKKKKKKQKKKKKKKKKGTDKNTTGGGLYKLDAG